MSKYVYIIPIYFLVLTTSCIVSNEPDLLNFSEIEINFRIDGFVGRRSLEISNNGNVEAIMWGFDTTPADIGEVMLKEEEFDNIKQLFRSFSRFEKTYEPSEIVADVDVYFIEFTYDGITDTVLVERPFGPNIPLALLAIISRLEHLFYKIINTN